MVEKVCNLWLEPATYRCILTTGALTAEGRAVLDDGVAKEAVGRFQGLETDLGRLLAARGNQVHLIRPGLVSFPIKQFRWSKLSLQVIERSVHQLRDLVAGEKTLLPRPACGPGEPSWDELGAILRSLPDNIVLIQHT